MSDFTYTVFLIVASLIGSLVGVLAAGVVAVIAYDTHRPIEVPSLQFAGHQSNYSTASASTGSTDAARRAGK